MLTKADTAGVHDDHVAAAFGELFEIGGGDGVVLDGIRADDDGAVGVFDFVEGGGHGGGAYVFHECRDRGCVAEAGAMVDVVVVEARADEFLEEVGFFIRAFRGAEAGDGFATFGVA